MGCGDLKHDVIFKKVFGEHPDVPAGLLNDLLDRSGAEAIAEVAARGWTPSEAQHRPIADCADADTLNRWLERSLTAPSLDAALPPDP